MLDQFIQVLENFSNQILHIICYIICSISFAPCFISARLKTENMIKGTIEHVKHDIADTYRWTESVSLGEPASTTVITFFFRPVWKYGNTPKLIARFQLIKNMAESQVNYMRSFLETYAPNKTPEGVFKALDAISPPHRYKMTIPIIKIKCFQSKIAISTRIC